MADSRTYTGKIKMNLKNLGVSESKYYNTPHTPLNDG